MLALAFQVSCFVGSQPIHRTDLEGLGKIGVPAGKQRHRMLLRASKDWMRVTDHSSSSGTVD